MRVRAGRIAANAAIAAAAIDLTVASSRCPSFRFLKYSRARTELFHAADRFGLIALQQRLGLDDATTKALDRYFAVTLRLGHIRRLAR